ALFRRVEELFELGRTSVEIKRKTIQRLMDQGLFPFTKRYLGTLRLGFSYHKWQNFIIYTVRSDTSRHN
ncbi:hypothetical protein B7Z17_03710, partial [Candidatus Saccharibacteria bacterium 32-49-10]